jgi:uncharacterized membrane protein YedE/YeeE
MDILLAIIAGFGAGYILERGDFCFHSTWRDLLRQPSRPDLFRAYLLLLVVSIPLVQGMIALGWIAPWIPPFAWQANLFGGLVFGVGMVVAASCITGLFYKLGHGMLGTLVGLAAWGVGDLLTYIGPLSPFRDMLNASPLTVGGESATVINTLGPMGAGLLAVGWFGAAIYLWRAPHDTRGKLWGWLRLGAVMGLFLSGAWLLARIGGSDYTYGTSRVPTGIFQALTGGSVGGSPWIPIALLSLVPGALLAARLSGTLWVRGETAKRYAELAGGGLLMGVGAGIAGGCNLGHSMVGVPLLSLGSITTTLAIITGVFLADRALKFIRVQSLQPAKVR